MISEIDLPLNDTKNDQVRIFEKSKFNQIVNFRAEIGLLNEIQNAIYRVYSESARQWLPESVKKKYRRAKTPLNANHPFQLFSDSNKKWSSRN